MTSSRTKLLTLSLVLVGSAAYFAVAGLPYDYFGWMNKAWAQQPYTSELIVRPPVVTPPQDDATFVSEQANRPTVLTARTDSNGDGMVDENDSPVAFTFPADGSAPVSITLPDDATNIFDIGVSQDETFAAYVVETAEGNILILVNLLTEETITVDLPSLQSPALFFGTLYVVNNNNTEEIPTLYSIDETTGDVLYERELDIANTEVTFSLLADQLLAYTPDSQQFAFYDLMDEIAPPLTIEIEGSFALAPQWSPDGASVFFIEQDPQTLTESLKIVSAADGTTRTLPLPEYADTVSLVGEWSNSGEYITVHAVGEEDTLAAERVAIVDVEAGAFATLGGFADVYVPLGWAADDSALLVVIIDPDGETQLITYNPIDGTFDILRLDEQIAVQTAWHPELPLLALMAQADATVDDYNFVLYDLETRTFEPVSETTLSAFDTLSLRWSADGNNLIFISTVDDPMVELLGAQTTSFVIDVATGESAPFLPEGIELE